MCGACSVALSWHNSGLKCHWCGKVRGWPEKSKCGQENAWQPDPLPALTKGPLTHMHTHTRVICFVDGKTAIILPPQHHWCKTV